MSDCTRIEPLLSAHLDGELTGGEATAVAAHLDVCDRCAAEARDLAHVRNLVRSMPVRRLPDGVRLHPERVLGTEPARRPLARVGATLALTGGLLAGAAFSLGGQPSPEAEIVTVPLDDFVADHVVQTINSATFMPVGVEVGP